MSAGFLGPQAIADHVVAYQQGGPGHLDHYVALQRLLEPTLLELAAEQLRRSGRSEHSQETGTLFRDTLERFVNMKEPARIAEMQPSAVRGFLQRTMQNLLVDAVRGRNRKERAERAVAEVNTASEFDPAVPLAWESDEGRPKWDALPPLLREWLLARIEEGLSHADPSVRRGAKVFRENYVNGRTLREIVAAGEETSIPMASKKMTAFGEAMLSRHGGGDDR